MSSIYTMAGRLVGPYTVVRKLGEGGMGVVYEAVHKQTGRHVALKFLHEEFQEDQEQLGRFFNEAIASSKLDHPGLVQIFDSGLLDGQTAYLIMEYLRGPSLERRLAEPDGRQGLPLGEALNVAWQTATVLAQMESCGIVHRDLKPGNLMLVPDAVAAQGVRVKILDLGLAKLNRKLFASAVHTRCGMVMGTPLYMSPEQCRDASDVDGKTDVYSLGVVLFEMLSGQPPFVTSGCDSMLALHLFAPVPRLKDVAPRVPEALSELVTAMLSKSAAERPTMAAVCDCLAKLRAEPLEHSEAVPVIRQPTAAREGSAVTTPVPSGVLERMAKRAQRSGTTPGAVPPTPLGMVKTVLVAPEQSQAAVTRVLMPADTLVRDPKKVGRRPSFLDRSMRDLTVDFVRLSLASVPLARPLSASSPVMRGSLLFLVSILLWMGGQTPDPGPHRAVSSASSASAVSGSAHPSRRGDAADDSASKKSLSKAPGSPGRPSRDQEQRQPSMCPVVTDGPSGAPHKET